MIRRKRLHFGMLNKFSYADGLRDGSEKPAKRRSGKTGSWKVRKTESEQPALRTCNEQPELVIN